VFVVTRRSMRARFYSRFENPPISFAPSCVKIEVT
jgi:hypothetical protein